ncbi:MAG: hypothetical protein BV456_01760 [Thermoplasmata archaeon M8B2D]|nr:MAG: hypothetical protein BV456_01760 [Thermoplasmata archaeon M8B2D]
MDENLILLIAYLLEGEPIELEFSKEDIINLIAKITSGKKDNEVPSFVKIIRYGNVKDFFTSVIDIATDDLIETIDEALRKFYNGTGK